jgi:hypothetical protein
MIDSSSEIETLDQGHRHPCSWLFHQQMAFLMCPPGRSPARAMVSWFLSIFNLELSSFKPEIPLGAKFPERAREGTPERPSQDLHGCIGQIKVKRSGRMKACPDGDGTWCISLGTLASGVLYDPRRGCAAAVPDVVGSRVNTNR